mmetsp:Transcript_12686/g.50701  ORF Transcript_12686/g.50701 Transcript_12686/m.50701 type:complete len:426 (-) Transcript_12686:1078-2355(-)
MYAASRARDSEERAAHEGEQQQQEEARYRRTEPSAVAPDVKQPALLPVRDGGREGLLRDEELLEAELVAAGAHLHAHRRHAGPLLAAAAAAAAEEGLPLLGHGHLGLGRGGRRGGQGRRAAEVVDLAHVGGKGTVVVAVGQEERDEELVDRQVHDGRQGQLQPAASLLVHAGGERLEKDCFDDEAGVRVVGGALLQRNHQLRVVRVACRLDGLARHQRRPHDCTIGQREAEELRLRVADPQRDRVHELVLLERGCYVAGLHEGDQHGHVLVLLYAHPQFAGAADEELVAEEQRVHRLGRHLCRQLRDAHGCEHCRLELADLHTGARLHAEEALLAVYLPAGEARQLHIARRRRHLQLRAQLQAVVRLHRVLERDLERGSRRLALGLQHVPSLHSGALHRQDARGGRKVELEHAPRRVQDLELVRH